jgi:formylglycine-generating enzyme required for sulfatase activity
MIVSRQLVLLSILGSVLLGTPGLAKKPDPQKSSKSTQALPQEFSNSLGMMMVKLPDGFWAGKYEVTQEEFSKLMNYNRSKTKSPRFPANNVAWSEAKKFCSLLTQKDAEAGLLPQGFVYDLPTEKQWEYYNAEARLEDAVTSMGATDKLRESVEPVGTLGANKFGLYDTRGNVWEWCQEVYPSMRPCRILRGASYQTYESKALEVSYRNAFEEDGQHFLFGFRCVLVPVNKNP